MERDILMSLIDEYEDTFVVIPSIIIFALAIAGIYAFDSGWLEGLLGGVGVTTVYQTARLIALKRFRRAKLAWRQHTTKIFCAQALGEIEAQGLRWTFFSDDPEHDRSCDLCQAQTVSLYVGERFTPVASAMGIIHDVHLGSFCPGCGQRHKCSADPPVQGDLKDLLAYLDTHRDRYVLTPPKGVQGLRTRIKAVQESNAQHIAALGNGRAELDMLESLLHAEEGKHGPPGYRVAAQLPPVPVEETRPPDLDADDAVEDIVEEEKQQKRQYQPGLHCKIS